MPDFSKLYFSEQGFLKSDSIKTRFCILHIFRYEYLYTSHKNSFYWKYMFPIMDDLLANVYNSVQFQQITFSYTENMT